MSSCDLARKCPILGILFAVGACCTTGPGSADVPSGGDGARIRGLVGDAFACDGKHDLLAVERERGSVELWAYKGAGTFERPIALVSGLPRVSGLSFSENGSCLAVASGGDAVVWIRSGTWAPESPPYIKGSATIEALVWSTGENLLATAGADGVRVWDRARHTQQSQVCATPASTLAFVADDAVLAIGGSSGEIDLYDVRSGRRLASVDNKERRGSIVAMCDLRAGQCAAASSDGRLTVFDSGGRVLRSLKIEPGEVGTWRGVTCMAVDAGRTRLGVGAYDGRVLLGPTAAVSLSVVSIRELDQVPVRALGFLSGGELVVLRHDFHGDVQVQVVVTDERRPRGP